MAGPLLESKMIEASSNLNSESYLNVMIRERLTHKYISRALTKKIFIAWEKNQAFCNGNRNDWKTEKPIELYKKNARRTENKIKFSFDSENFSAALEHPFYFNGKEYVLTVTVTFHPCELEELGKELKEIIRLANIHWEDIAEE